MPCIAMVYIWFPLTPWVPTLILVKTRREQFAGITQPRACLLTQLRGDGQTDVIYLLDGSFYSSQDQAIES